MPHLSVQQAMHLALTHHQAGRLVEADTVYRQILQVQPNYPEALHLLGVVAGQMQQFDAAVDLIARAIAIAPANPSYHFNHGIFLENLQQLDQAIAAYQRAIDCRADYVEAHVHLGNAWRTKGQFELATGCYERAATLAPNLAEAHISLGNISLDRGQPERAIAAYQRALSLRPDYTQARTGLANALVIHGKMQHKTDADSAIESFQQALHYQQDDPRAHYCLANALNLKNLPDEAISHYQQAISRYEASDPKNPDLPGALCMLGHALNKTGETELAMRAFERARWHDPSSKMAGDLRLYNLIFDPIKTPADILTESLEWGRRFAPALCPADTVYESNADPSRPLRIGYVSADFHRHVANHFMLPLLASHDPRAVELFCYANVKSPDQITAKMKQLVSNWRDIEPLPDEQAAELIRRDRIDILVDLNLHTADNRLPLFARKPAPVQATWLGYPGTTGLASIDYRLTDPFLDPPDADVSCYCEKSIRLRDTFWCYDPLESATAIQPTPAIIAGNITFGCLNDFHKINRDVLALWAGVLNQVAGSRLLLLAPPGQTRDRVHQRLAAHGIEAKRVEFVSRQPRERYLEIYHRIDISLDTFPCNGHTTSLDSLWMGVPIITLAGNTVAGRAGVSFLFNLGLTDLIAHCSEEYAQIAAHLAIDLPRLSSLRGGLRERMRQSPLMDAPRFARSMEAAYRTMWEARRDSHKS